jgi:sulfur carrier protein
MSTIWVNGEELQWKSNQSVGEVVSNLVASTRGVAVAVDRSVIPRSEWDSTILEAGAQVEIVSAAAGG